jgi:hypothetical protein
VVVIGLVTLDGVGFGEVLDNLTTSEFFFGF